MRKIKIAVALLIAFGMAGALFGGGGHHRSSAIVTRDDVARARAGYDGSREQADAIAKAQGRLSTDGWYSLTGVPSSVATDPRIYR